MEFQDLELAKAADIIARDLLCLKPGEDCVIVADSESDRRVIEATARATHALGADTTIVWYAAPPDVGEKAKIPRSATAAMANTDVVVEFCKKYLLYSESWKQFMAAGVRYLCLPGMDVGMAVRTIANVDFPLAVQLGDKLAELTQKAHEMRITTPAGMDLIQKLDPVNRLAEHDSGKAETPGAFFLGGQISWVPVEDKTHGTIVFDGSLWPPVELGILSSPIELTIEEGRITAIKGGREAKIFEKWMASWEDPHMYNISHGCYGANPGAKLTGNILEDERVFGCVEFGLGYQPSDWGGRGSPAKAHTDGICLNASVWLDGEQIEDEGTYVHPELAELCEALGK